MCIERLLGAAIAVGAVDAFAFVDGLAVDSGRERCLLHGFVLIGDRSYGAVRSLSDLRKQLDVALTNNERLNT